MATYSWPNLNVQYNKGNGAGQGFSVGLPNQTTAAAVATEGWTVLSTDPDGNILAQRPDKVFVVVSLSDAPWGVVVTP